MTAGVAYIVDDDEAVRDLLGRVLQKAGVAVETFPSGTHFLDSYTPERRGCLLLDVSMPDMNGLELQRALHERRAYLPIIFVTGSADVSMAIAGMKAGAMDYNQKPIDNQALVACTLKPLELDRHRDAERIRWQAANAHIVTLTPREREVLEHIVDGKTNKAIATTLGVSPRTLEIHRARILSKTGVEGLAELVRLFLLWQDGRDRY
jgi:FixJ family two-component response regulator